MLTLFPTFVIPISAELFKLRIEGGVAFDQGNVCMGLVNEPLPFQFPVHLNR